MSLVDYASSDEEDTEIGVKEEHENQQSSNDVAHAPPPPPLPPPAVSVSQSESRTSSLDKEATTAFSIPSPTIDKLPDASLLLNSPMLPHSVNSSSDHYCRVAVAVAENASRKREANGPMTSSLRGKVPRGSLPHSRSIPDTDAGQLVPPQLRGRSNIVTEDIGKLFVRKQGQA